MFDSLVDFDGNLVVRNSEKKLPPRFSRDFFLFEQIPKMLESDCFPKRLLLDFLEKNESQSNKNKKDYAATASIATGIFISIVLAAFNVSALTYFLVLIFALILVYSKTKKSNVFEKGNAWQKTQWLDFDQKIWRSKTVYFDKNSKSFQERSLLFNEIALICGAKKEEVFESYDVGLYRVDEAGVWFLNKIADFDDKKSCIKFARNLSSFWGIDAFFQSGSLKNINRLEQSEI